MNSWYLTAVALRLLQNELGDPILPLRSYICSGRSHVLQSNRPTLASWMSSKLYPDHILDNFLDIIQSPVAICLSLIKIGLKVLVEDVFSLIFFSPKVFQQASPVVLICIMDSCQGAEFVELLLQPVLGQATRKSCSSGLLACEAGFGQGSFA